jgi:hypothetical protein
MLRIVVDPLICRYYSVSIGCAPCVGVAFEAGKLLELISTRI